jgi:hypothetical protein
MPSGQIIARPLSGRFPSASCWGSDADDPEAPQADTSWGDDATASPSLA